MDNKKQSAKSRIKLGLENKNVTKRKLRSLQREIAEYERDRRLSSTSTRQSSQFFGEVIKRIEEEYQTKTDIIDLMRSIPITELQFEKVKRRATTETLKSLLGNLDFLMQLHKTANELEKLIEISLRSTTNSIDTTLLKRFGTYENCLYADVKKVEKYKLGIKEKLIKSIKSPQGLSLTKELDDLIVKKTKKDDEFIRILKKLKVVKAELLQDARDKKQLIIVIDYLIFSCQQVKDTDKVEKEITELIKKQKEEQEEQAKEEREKEEKEQLRTNGNKKTEIDTLAQLIEMETIEHLLFQQIDELDKKIEEYQLLPGAKDPIVLTTSLTRLLHLRKEGFVVEKIKAFKDYLKSNTKLEKKDLPNLQTMIADVLSYSQGLTLTVPTGKLIELIENMYNLIKYEFQFEEEVYLENEPPTPSAIQSDSTSSVKYVNTFVTGIQQTLKSGEKLRDKLVHQKIAENNIPIIVVYMHGGVMYDDDFRCFEYRCPMDVLYRYIAGAPYEINASKSTNVPIEKFMIKNELKEQTTKIKDVFELATKTLYDPTGLDAVNFINIKTSKKGPMKYGTTFNIQRRNQYIINYNHTRMCHKSWALDRDPATKMGIYFVNKTQQIEADTNILETDDFIKFIKAKNDGDNTKYEKKNGKQRVRMFRSIHFYDYLKSIGFQQAIVIDYSCEDPIHLQTSTIPRRPSENDEIAYDTIYLHANLNGTSRTTKFFMKLLDIKFKRTNPAYQTYRANALTAQKRAKHKSRNHAFSIVNGKKKGRTR